MVVWQGRSILVISDNARVHGKVVASHVIINGDVRYETLEMHAGATVEGELKPLKRAEKPALKLAASNEV